MITLLKNKSESQIIWSPYTANRNIQCGDLGATIQETQYLKVFEMRCLQAIRGVIRADGLQHIKVRMDIFTPESITDVIRHKKTQVVWARLPMQRYNNVRQTYKQDFKGHQKK